MAQALVFRWMADPRATLEDIVRVEGEGWQQLADWLKGLAGDDAGVPCELAEAVKTRCRLVALRCPDEAA